MKHRVLLIGINRYVVVAAHAGVHELNHDFLPFVAQSLDVAVTPSLEGIGRSLAATLFNGTLIVAAGGMGIDLVGRAEDDIDATAVGPPSRLAGCEMFVGVGDAAVMFF